MTRKRLFGLSLLLVAGMLALIIVPAACDARIASVSANTYYSGSAIDDNGTLWKWGFDNGTPGQYEPYIVAGITDVKETDGALYYTLILRNDGTVWIMDHAPFGSMGYKIQETPLQLEGVGNITAIAADGHNENWIAVKNDGTVATWDPVTWKMRTVGGLSDVKQIAEGAFGCYIALKNDGTVWTWGRDGTGVLGIASLNTPGPVPGLTDVKAVAAGAYFFMALKNDGTVWAWGINDDGQLGDGKPDTIEGDRPYPGQVYGLTDIVAITAGESSGYALRKDGTVWTWGKGYRTQGAKYMPSMVENLDGIVQISAGDTGYVLALDINGTVWGWGQDDYGQLGNLEHGPNHHVDTPVKALFSIPLSRPALKPSWMGAVSSVTTPPNAQPAVNDDSIQYLTFGDDGTLYAFTATNLIAYDSAGSIKWNLTIPGKWMHDSVHQEAIYETADNGAVSGGIQAKSVKATPTIDIADGHVYIYVLRNVSDIGWHDIDYWTSDNRINGSQSVEKVLIAISPDGKVEWQYSLVEDIGWFDRKYVEAMDGKIFFFHDYTETVLSPMGSVLFEIKNVSDPVAVMDDGTIYALQAVKAYWGGLYRADTGEYLDFRQPGTTLEAFDKNGNKIWSKDTGVTPVRQYFSADVGEGFHSMPLVNDGILYLPTDSGIATLDRNGQEVWSKQFGGENYRMLDVMPADSKGNLYFKKYNGDFTFTIRSIDNTGKDASSIIYKPPSMSVLSGRDGILYEATDLVVGKSMTTDLDTSMISAIDAQSGRRLWNITLSIISRITTTINRSNVDMFFHDSARYAQTGQDQGPVVYGYAATDVVPTDKAIYVNFKSVSYDYPIEFDWSNATYARALYALDNKGNIVWQNALDSFGTVWAANNTTVFYAGDDGKINIVLISLAAAGGLALLGAAYMLMKYFMFGTVTRARSRLDDNDNRKHIMQFILASPGVTLNEISRQTGFNVGTVRYHLLILGLNHKIRTFKEGKFVRYFPNSNLFTTEEQLAISLIRRKPLGGIVGALLETPGLTYADLSRKLGLSDVAISEHVKTLYDYGAISREKKMDGRLAFRVTPEFSSLVDGLKARNVVIITA